MPKLCALIRLLLGRATRAPRRYRTAGTPVGNARDITRSKRGY